MAEGAPPLYFLLLRGWVAIVGTSLASVRAFSALMGHRRSGHDWSVCGPSNLSTGWTFFGSSPLLHPFHLAYSQEARPYAMVFALATLTIWMAWEERVWLFTLASTALLWTHPWGLFVWLVSAGLMIGALFQKSDTGMLRRRGWHDCCSCLLPWYRQLPHFGISVGCLCLDPSGPSRLLLLSCSVL